MLRYSLAFIASLCLAVSGIAVCAELTAQRFALPDHGTLQLAFPSSWRPTLHQAPSPMPPTVELAPVAGAPFQIFVTAIWPTGQRGTLPNIGAIHDEVEAAAKAIAAQSVEGTLPLQDLRGPRNRGYYFHATDRAPKPGEYKYLTQGIVQLGAINLAFTVLTNDGQDGIVNAALDMLRGAAQTSDAV